MDPQPSSLHLSDLQRMLDSLQQFIAKLDPQDVESLEVIQLAQTLASRIVPPSQHGMFPDIQRTTQELVGMNVTVLGLTLKPDGKERACARGALESEGCFLTLDATKHLIKLARDSVSRSMEGGCRFLADILLLRLSAVLKKHRERVYIVTDYPLNSVELYENYKYGGVVDYVLAKYPRAAGAMILAPEVVLADEYYRKLGSENIFAAKTLNQLEIGVPQCVLATAAWCQYAGEAVMRGAVTTGDQWIFFAYKHGEQGNCYARTGVYQLEEDLSNLDLILGILVDWVEHTKVFEPFEYFNISQYEAR